MQYVACPIIDRLVTLQNRRIKIKNSNYFMWLLVTHTEPSQNTHVCVYVCYQFIGGQPRSESTACRLISTSHRRISVQCTQ